ncbi:alpha amylase C-terminal domain-containing protein, partial [Desulfovibrio sp.]|uniref:alpha amylase C-terminal domain-containing protein n=1 Tax=Desulfovibrio sp. TaxID=885 RepID=UPI0025BE819E
PRDMGSMWHEMTNHRPYDRTISYVECHDQCINGKDAMIWRLLGERMYSHMSVATDSWDVSRGLAFYRLMRLITLGTADAGYLNFMGNEFGHPEWLDAENYAHRQWHLAQASDLKYAFLAAWDKAQMLEMVQPHLNSFGQSPLFRFIHEEKRLLAFERGQLLFAFNFHELDAQKNLTFAVSSGKYVELLSSDERRFGGHGNLDISGQPVEHFTQPLPDRHEGNIHLYLPPLVGLVLLRKNNLKKD